MKRLHGKIGPSLPSISAKVPATLIKLSWTFPAYLPSDRICMTASKQDQQKAGPIKLLLTHRTVLTNTMVAVLSHPTFCDNLLFSNKLVKQL